MTPVQARVLVEGLHFPEGPRWRAGRLWCSDMHGGRVLAIDATGRIDATLTFPGRPSGLGWTPDGRLLAVSMLDRRVLRLDGTTWTPVADLRGVASFRCNDMLVDGRGRAYVGSFGFDLDAGAPFAPGEVVLVEPDGRARVVADNLRFPNGMVLTPDGRTLIVAESMGPALRAYDVAADGSLSGGRPWAELVDAVPDGICLDADGAVWLASPIAHELVRVGPGGRVLARVAVSNHAFACMLGGPDRRTMFALTADTSGPEWCAAHAAGRIETFAVDVPGAGLP
jgi:sugar lactone lactonase YvrE